MSFSGDLEHLPIVDIIQLLHGSRRSGTLTLKSRKGESQLVFSEGYIVSANHLNSKIRIGQVLMDMEAITKQQLGQALLEQKKAGDKRVPLIATLLEGGYVKKEEAYKGLQLLIEMTIVEVLTWNRGTFSLDVDKVIVAGDYRYFPETLHQDLQINTQSVLMDALRIYDEKKRDGLIADEQWSEDGPDEAEQQGEESAAGFELSEDILGLDQLDRLEKKIPGVFKSIKDHDPAAGPRQAVQTALSAFTPEEQEQLTAYLQKSVAATASAPTEGAARALILLSRDPFTVHASKSLGKQDGWVVFSSDDAASLELFIDQAFTKGMHPQLILDAPQQGLTREDLTALWPSLRERYPQLSILQLTPVADAPFALHAVTAGIGAILPKPERGTSPETYGADTLAFLEAVRTWLHQRSAPAAPLFANQLKTSLLALDQLKEAPEVCLALLGFAAEMFERALTLVVGKGEVIAERAIGIKGDRSQGASAPLKFKLPLTSPSILQQTIDSGRLYFGGADEALLSGGLFPEIGAPNRPQVLLCPLRSMGRVIAVVYADFGARTATAVELEWLDILAGHAGLVLDNAHYRKRFEKSAGPA